jgi:phage terminase large subunit
VRSSPTRRGSIVRLPHLYAPRDYQLKALGALERGVKRAVLVWHRRAGKDLMLLNRTIAASQERIGIYWHVFPTAKQGRKIIWDGVTKDGRPFLDYWPRGLIAERNATEMKLKCRNGSVWQIVGSDNYNEALVGGNTEPVMIACSAPASP